MFKRSAHSAGPFLGSAAAAVVVVSNESANQPTHPTNQATQTTNQPFFGCLVGLFSCAVVFPHFLCVWSILGHSGTPHGTILGPFSELKFQKMPSGAQNGPRLAPGRRFANVPRPFGRIFGSPWAPPNRPKIDLWAHKIARLSFLIDFYGLLRLTHFFNSF